MFGSDILDVAIGLAFLFFIGSLVVTAARETIEGFLQSRAVHLERGIRELLKDEDGKAAASQLYAHPMINSLFRGEYDPDGQLIGRRFARKDAWKRLKYRSNLPAYIPARNFALALLDLSARGSVAGADDNTGPASFAAVREGISVNIANPALRRLILVTLDNAKGDLEQARINLEKIFDSVMDRVSGWYRKETQMILLILGAVVAVSFNIDTVHVGRELYRNKAVREVILAEAGAATKADAAAGPLTLDCAGRAIETISCVQEQMTTIGYPVGWDDRPFTWQHEDRYLPSFNPAAHVGWFSFPGWLLTALALSLGAPFWFDVLNRLMVIRSTVKPHEKSPEESSEDRQAPSTNAPASTAATNAPQYPGPARPVSEDADFVPQKWASGDPAEGSL